MIDEFIFTGVFYRTLVICMLTPWHLIAQSGATELPESKNEYHYGFETALTNPPWAKEGGGNIAEIVDDPSTTTKNQVLKAELPLPGPNKTWNNSNTRSEIRWQRGSGIIPNWFPNESDYSYQFRVYVPLDHICDPIDPEIITQWHQPNGFAVKSPPLSLRIQNCNIKLRYITTDIFDGPQKSAIAKTISSSVDFTKGSWHYFIIDVRWDYQRAGGTGFVKVYMDTAGWPDKEDMIINHMGPVGQNNGVGANFKLGVYKWRWKQSADVEEARNHLPSILERLYYYDDVTIKEGHELSD